MFSTYFFTQWFLGRIIDINLCFINVLPLPLFTPPCILYTTLFFPSVGLNELPQYILSPQFPIVFSLHSPSKSLSAALHLSFLNCWHSMEMPKLYPSSPFHTFSLPFHLSFISSLSLPQALALSLPSSFFFFLFVDILRLPLMDHPQISAPSLHFLFPHPPQPQSLLPLLSIFLSPPLPLSPCRCCGNTFSFSDPLLRLFPIYLSLSLSHSTRECWHERVSLIDHCEASAPVLNLRGNSMCACVGVCLFVCVCVFMCTLEEPMQAFCSAHLWPSLVLSNFLLLPLLYCLCQPSSPPDSTCLLFLLLSSFLSSLKSLHCRKRPIHFVTSLF